MTLSENPGGLPPEDYVSIIVYLLQASGYQASDDNAQLPGDSFQLRRYVIDVPGLEY